MRLHNKLAQLIGTLVWFSSQACLGLADQALSESVRREIEADWRRHDDQRMAQLVRPGVIRFPDAIVNWPGLPMDERPTVPKARAPRLDGRMTDACWKSALEIPAQTSKYPVYRLCHDGSRLYVAATIPVDSLPFFRGAPTAADAAGAVDGVKDGRYGFHCGHQPNPWWEVDLGTPQQIARIVVYNRLDYGPGLHNADNLVILTSDDAQSWTVRYRNRGKHFGGVRGAPPLTVEFEDLTARFVRLQVPSDSPIFFHLDEVEIYGRDDPDRNLALHKPARQSSLSVWSRGGLMGSSLLGFGDTLVGLSFDDPPRVTVNGQPIADGAASVGEQKTTVEFALPLGSQGWPGEVRFAGDVRQVLRLGAEWQIAWAEVLQLGYGRNKLAVEVRSERTLRQPIEIGAETVVLTPFGIERHFIGRTVVTRPGRIQIEFMLEAEGPAAVVVTAKQGPYEWSGARPFFVEPIREVVRRGQHLLSDFGMKSPQPWRELRRRLRELEVAERTHGPNLAARSDLYRAARWLARDIAFSDPLLDFSRLLFVKRYTQQTYPDVCLNHMPWVSRPGGDICLLSPISPAGEVTPLLAGALGPGHVHGIDLSSDAKRIVFGYARAKSDEPPAQWLNRAASYELRRTEEPIHIFEIAVDGSDLRQLTDGEWSDLDPTYLPNGDVAFVSERCAYSLQCNEYDKDETSCNLYAVSPGTGAVRRLTVSKDGDYLPHLLDNGSLAYTRWEYQERNWANIQSIWIVAPDGTGADALYKQHFNDPWALEDIRSIPGSHKLVAIATGHHTLPAGPVVIVDPHVGINNPDGIQIVTPGVPPPEGGMAGRVVPEGGVCGTGGHYMTPWALSEKRFLVAYTHGPMTDENGYALYLIDVYGTRELIYCDPTISCFSPIPVRPRPRPLLIADTRLGDDEYATCIVTDVHEGLDDLEPGSIRYLRVAQRIAWPYDNESGGQRYEPDVKQVMVNWTPVRVLGTVPVERDGSAYFRVPAGIPVYFQALDENQMELRRMRSFINFQPGEVRACAGCHETRGAAPANVPSLLALRRPPSRLEPPPWGTRVISFLRDIQPVFDRYCVRCHSGLKPGGGLDFSGGLTPKYNRAYETINAAALVSRSNVGDDAKITAPLSFGSRKSKLVNVLQTTHRERVRMSEEDRRRLIVWIDANAPYHAEFINKRPKVPPYNLATDAQLREVIESVHRRRCADCHQVREVSRLDWIDIRSPSRSLFLLAPLANEASDGGRCSAPVYQTTADADYQLLLRRISEAVEQTWARPRRDVRTLER